MVTDRVLKAFCKHTIKLQEYKNKIVHFDITYSVKCVYV